MKEAWELMGVDGNDWEFFGEGCGLKKRCEMGLCLGGLSVYG